MIGRRAVRHVNGVREVHVRTKRLQMQVLEAGREEGPMLVFLHGNASSSTVWEPWMLRFAGEFRLAAPDLRGYGSTDSSAVIDAAKGGRDWAEDVLSLLDALDVRRAVVVGHSLGGWVGWNLLADAPERILAAVLIAPGPPCGMGGAHGDEGRLNWPNGAGSGAGLVHPELVRQLRAGERGEGDGVYAPRVLMRRLFWEEGFRHDREEELLSAFLLMHLGERQYPGDFSTCEEWPGVAPGRWGPMNALSPLHNAQLTGRLAAVGKKPPVLWIRGDRDRIVSDASFSDPGHQGAMGWRPGWPGEAVFPPQPMVSQIRHALEQRVRNGGTAKEALVRGAGHSPFLEKPLATERAMRRFLDEFVRFEPEKAVF